MVHRDTTEIRARAWERAVRRGVVLAVAVAVIVGVTLWAGGVTMATTARVPSAMANAKIDLYQVRGEPTDAVRKASAAELESAVKGFLEGWDRHAFVDAEIIWLAGMGVGKAGAAGVDTAIGAWVGAAPTPKRRAIAAAFLEGYWPWHSGVDAAVVAALQASLGEIEADDEAYGTTLRALAGVVAERSGLDVLARARIRQELLRRSDDLVAKQRLEGTVAALRRLE
ncbi:MAG: hypothetical protein WKG00_39205 [Polyangiaceae bacterium]